MTEREKKIQGMVRAVSYVLVAGAWVALLTSDWIVLWGPDANWQSYVVVICWTALTLRRLRCDLNLLLRHTWWDGYTACACDGRDPDHRNGSAA